MLNCLSYAVVWFLADGRNLIPRPSAQHAQTTNNNPPIYFVHPQMLVAPEIGDATIGSIVGSVTKGPWAL